MSSFVKLTTQTASRNASLGSQPSPLAFYTDSVSLVDSALQACQQGTFHWPWAFFSAGVEVGHFTFVTLTLIAVARRWTMELPTWSWKLPPYAIGSMAAYWLIARLAAF
jgi:hypothetical protein